MWHSYNENEWKAINGFYVGRLVTLKLCLFFFPIKKIISLEQDGGRIKLVKSGVGRYVRKLLREMMDV